MKLHPIILLVSAMLISGTLGCHHTANSLGSRADLAQQDFLQEFLTAHNKKDLEAQEKLVDWDDTTEYSREHFIREYIQAQLNSKISSANIENIPGLNARLRRITSLLKISSLWYTPIRVVRSD